MDTIETLLTVLIRDSGDDTARLALADALEEADSLAQAELTRLGALLRMEPQSSETLARENRIRQLLTQGVAPCVPTRNDLFGMRFVLIPAGSFLMGSPDDEADRYADEGPVHRVTLSKSFWMGATPVTQGQFFRIMNHNPSYFRRGGDAEEVLVDLDTTNHPVESVVFDDMLAFCARLRQLSPKDCKARLPTEAEWEYACRGGIVSTTPYHYGNVLLPHMACFDFSHEDEPMEGQGIPPRSTVAVGAYRPNGYGLFDLHGNVWEQCQDRFSETYYSSSPAKDPKGPKRGTYRVVRGGSWLSRVSVCRTACRNPVAAAQATGFRLVLDV
jgi:uncharacterized protein (TIGR02996 family)